ncbi:UDP-N-acetylmuramoyl-L-alanyl-D-glutamate--2,6-diaminopimelate ligase [Clostridium acetobutylicum]|uniref:UDP-N-acetylmuramoyl-L-alanyl-D-glutamate--2,6-diaminopimelate ligase 1 n=1 Tax=Clostridium acetobutylicum (strain ATCC 824 / DSM 792 / JCM 1419 / IAM 19013 / LMG 5710 / NBRC 13948 / NRRL B-527 / VKM B-1787 / 2291 / W) TaxID=272562 RepID=MURE1_CLOAB|nr:MULTISPECIES: UDP-N-acetylmuramoyl-L-alanyl-D-glutamate--2,6-diaminopimelate ligase [Clostridium]Q97H84.1 RecName: Full=UDP-N-acetylmuramoyl-L-alanyl-D-glutamate--2,6-diaminopimelate ligase 1; AltName: Full=Meso-A2pm-adding enzyme 1; AltName: Full=Meso-diaminopimelate-adding enzyme 1; AltName: Full=UDP-MurNAc-L-Ala-D-Glu:meso-diaminopimelate ligase 1; AltName: Full=UDP-MurNAc-tripeptide synthetase 1; AltName: Full=UDP-N-acetylmuramyl-tripeptide synthetase 1 [Clostridium acetobutylicum ATCC 824]
MKLKKIIGDVKYELICGDLNVEIDNLNYDSRKVNEKGLFFCIEGYTSDGHDFIDKAVEKGADVIVCTKVPKKLPNCTVVKVEDGRKAMAVMGANFYDNPSHKLKLIGITGTNGKTTSTYMMKSMLESSGYKVGLIGTIANYIGDKKIESHRTTPESLELQKLFSDMVHDKIDYCVMEVSSHSLYLDRVYGIVFEEGIFTNLTQDHLDFHKTFENYYKAKMILFKNSKRSIINIDDKYGERVFKDAGNDKITYGLTEKADLKAENLKMTSRGTEFDLCYRGLREHVKINIPGKYNVYNALGSVAACLNEGISIEKVKDGLNKLSSVPGRCEIVTHNTNLDFDVVLDYAHTPDGLEKVLKASREFTKGRLISVFGCGGDRDKTKRPIMGEIGSKLSDIAVITSDNPRSENPEEIIKDIVQGIKTDNYVIVENRKEAIKKAMLMAKKDDVIVLAGKGHENYQILGDKTIHFDEKEIVSEFIKELF